MKQPLKPLKKKAWKVFSEYIRRRAADSNGLVRCYTCGATIPWREAQASHLLDGRTNSILFSEDGVQACCRKCNLFLNGNKEQFIPKFIDEFGRERYDELIRLKHTITKYSAQDYDEIYEMYKTKLKEL